MTKADWYSSSPSAD